MKKIIFLSTLFMAFFTMNVTATEAAADFGSCKYECYFKYPYSNATYNYGQQVKVEVKVKYGHNKIKYIKCFVGSKFIDTESRAPYQWRFSPKQMNLKSGDHWIKCVIYSHCGHQKEIRCKIIIKGHGGGGHEGGGEEVCHFNSPWELGWCKNRFGKGYKVCVVKKGHKKYIKVKKCNGHKWDWYNCKGYGINDVHGCYVVKCYGSCHNDGGHANNCNYKGNINYKLYHKNGWGNYIKVEFNPYKYQDIQWVELYIGGQRCSRESSAPYDWTPQKSSRLSNLKKGKKYELKCKIYTKCGEYKYVKKYITLGHSS